MFLAEDIRFCEIPEIVEKAVSKFGGMAADTIEDILAADEAARSFISGKV